MIKKFKAPTIKEAMQLVKDELGENAVILQTRKVNSQGMFDLLNPGMVEITAMVDESKNAELNPKIPSQKLYSPTSFKVPDDNYLAAEIKSELKALKEAITNMAEHIRYSKLLIFPELFRFLVETKGVEEALAAEIFQNLIFTLNGNELQDKNKIKQALLNQIARYLRTDGSLALPQNKPKIICLVGPTGMGKTTTVIKLATHPQFYGGHRVGLITIDTYRVAAAAQLKIFATLAKIPLEIVYQPTEFGTAVEKFQDRQVLLIDTAGRSPLNSEHLNNLRSFMEQSMPDEIHLVLSVSMRADNLLEAVKNFSALPINRVIFSKLDETPRIGNILNVAKQLKYPISFLTNGQTVPDDILLADKKFLANLILS